MSQAQTQTANLTRGVWGRITFHTGSQEFVEIYADLPPLEAPSIESLDRRYEASDKSWIDGWLQDEVDPCSPE